MKASDAVLMFLMGVSVGVVVGSAIGMAGVGRWQRMTRESQVLARQGIDVATSALRQRDSLQAELTRTTEGR